MPFDVFISYAWTNDAHREWVRLLASHLRLVGFNVGIDADVSYGDDLTGFMRKIRDSKHVLMIVDDNYVNRADNMPNSGVGIENHLLQSAIKTKPRNWISPLLINNKSGRLPRWLSDSNSKYFDFRSNFKQKDFPGSEQIEDLWRWLCDLPSDKSYAPSSAVIRKRLHRVEQTKLLQSPEHWKLPYLEMKNVEFTYEDSPNKCMTLGSGTYGFKLMVTTCGSRSVYVYNDYILAVGLIPEDVNLNSFDVDKAYRYITPGRNVTPEVGQSVVLQNKEGCICIVKLEQVIPEKREPDYSRAKIIFSYKIFLEEEKSADDSI